MNNRIVTFLTRRSILHKSQIGFLPKQRTSDHIYSLHTLINKNLKGKQRKIFTCFVDLKKAFDSVWHDGLLYKLLQIGIGGKTFDVIQSMYRNSRCAVKIGNCRTAFFQQGSWSEGRDAVWAQPCSTSTSTSWQKLWTAPATSRASLYMTPKSNACCMRTTWFWCPPQPRVSSTAWPCWNSTVRNGLWRSTWTKPESWCSRRRPGLREADTSSVTEEKSWSTAPATLTWASRSLHRGASVWLWRPCMRRPGGHFMPSNHGLAN